jgi:hypothetical protein
MINDDPNRCDALAILECVDTLFRELGDVVLDEVADLAIDRVCELTGVAARDELGMEERLNALYLQLEQQEKADFAWPKFLAEHPELREAE